MAEAGEQKIITSLQRNRTKTEARAETISPLRRETGSADDLSRTDVWTYSALL